MTFFAVKLGGKDAITVNDGTQAVLTWGLVVVYFMLGLGFLNVCIYSYHSMTHKLPSEFTTKRFNCKEFSL